MDELEHYCICTSVWQNRRRTLFLNPSTVKPSLTSFIGTALELDHNDDLRWLVWTHVYSIIVSVHRFRSWKTALGVVLCAALDIQKTLSRPAKKNEG